MTRDPSGQPQRHPGIDRSRRIARVLDDAYLDPILGFFFPGVGDLLTAGTGLYMVATAVRIGLPAVVIARMLVNLAVDALLGAIPLVGDVFDVVFKANRRNLALLESRTEGKSTAGDYAFLVLAMVLFLCALLVPIYLFVLLIRALF